MGYKYAPFHIRVLALLSGEPKSHQQLADALGAPRQRVARVAHALLRRQMANEVRVPGPYRPVLALVRGPRFAEGLSQYDAKDHEVTALQAALDPRPTFTLAAQDAVTWLRTLPDRSAQLVITDPPYESLEKHRARGTTTRLKHSKASSNDWFAVFPNARFPELFAEVYRVLAKDAHFYMFCDQETMFVAKPAAEAVGFKFWKPLVWDKQRIGMGYHYRARYEFVLFFEKGKRRLHDLGITDIIAVPRIAHGYPTEKPIEVSSVLVRQSASPGDIVLDPFFGSGSVGVAALQHGCAFAGADIDPKATEHALPRLAAHGRPHKEG